MKLLVPLLARALRRLLSGLLALLVLLSAIETGAWALFEVSWPWTTEVQGLLLATFALLGAAYGVHGNFHLGVDALVSRLPSPWHRPVARTISLVVCLLGVLLAYYGGALVRQVGNTLPATGWPAAVGYVPAVLGGLGIAFFAFAQLWHPTVDDDLG